MHDFLLAKEIVDELLKIIQDKKLDKISEAEIEIGTISLSHDGYDEHTEDISIDNLEFGLKTITKGTMLKKTKFKISKVEGDHWKLVSIK